MHAGVPEGALAGASPCIARRLPMLKQLPTVLAQFVSGGAVAFVELRDVAARSAAIIVVVAAPFGWLLDLIRRIEVWYACHDDSPADLTPFVPGPKLGCAGSATALRRRASHAQRRHPLSACDRRSIPTMSWAGRLTVLEDAAARLLSLRRLQRGRHT